MHRGVYIFFRRQLDMWMLRNIMHNHLITLHKAQRTLVVHTKYLVNFI